MEITRILPVGARPKSQVFFIRHFIQKIHLVQNDENLALWRQGLISQSL